MTNQQGAPEALRPITRYEVVDCIDSKHVPAVIPNGAGPWVRYEDHIAAMVDAQQPAPQPSPTPQADSQPAPVQEPVWDGKLSDTMQKALNALYLECSHEVARDVAFCVRQELEAIYTSYNTVKRMYGAARDRLEAMEAAQPQPDPFARAPADSVTAPASGANWQDISTAPKDAARYRWLADYLIGDRTDLDDEIIACSSKQELDAVINAARAPADSVTAGEHYCHAVKPQDADSPATCLACRWEGERGDLKEKS